MDRDNIYKMFSYSSVIGDQGVRQMKIRKSARELEYLIIKNCPKSDKTKLSIDRLAESIMWAISSISSEEVIIEGN